MKKTKKWPSWYYHDDHGKPLPNGRIRPGLDPARLNPATGTIGNRTAAVYRVNTALLPKARMVERLRKQLLSAPLTTWPTCRNLTGISIRQFTALRDAKVLTLLGQGYTDGHNFFPKAVKPPPINKINKRIAIKRKYGAGGEGENHRKLKEWIAAHPTSIGLSTVKKYELEHVFLSGDTVDILFELNDDNDAVVEIETAIPLPGCHQAIKYRALRCAERSLALDSKKVNAILVAWEIPQEVREFCNQYNILHYEIKK